MKKLLVSLLVLSACALNAGAEYYSGDCDGALAPCAFGLEVSAGIAPSFFLNKDCSTLVSCSGDCTTGCSVDALNCSEGPKFSDAFSNTPVYVSGGLFYNVCDSVQMFGEVAWRHARGNCVTDAPCVREGFPGEGFAFEHTYCNFNSIGGYVGVRHYCGGTFFDCVSPFWGFKVGVLHHGEISESIRIGENVLVPCVDATVVVAEETTPANFITYCKNNVVSGGAVFGFTADVWEDCLKFRFGVEVIASGCLRGSVERVCSVATDTQFVSPQTIQWGHIGTDLMIPVTFGFQYSY